MGQGGDVTGEGVGGVRGVELVVLDEGGVDVLEAIGQLAGDEVLVNALIMIRHPGNVAGRGLVAPSSVGLDSSCRVSDREGFSGCTECPVRHPRRSVSACMSRPGWPA